MVSRYEAEKAGLREDLQAAHAAVLREQRRRSQLEEDLHALLLKGMTSLNIDALALFQASKQRIFDDGPNPNPNPNPNPASSTGTILGDYLAATSRGRNRDRERERDEDRTGGVGSRIDDSSDPNPRPRPPPAALAPSEAPYAANSALLETLRQRARERDGDREKERQRETRLAFNAHSLPYPNQSLKQKSTNKSTGRI